MVGEIRDPETASIALQAGLTGHLVISTIHSDSSPGVFARLINMNIEPFLLASSVIGVMSIRLVRGNCPSCSQPYEPNPHMLTLTAHTNWENASFRRGSGCAECFETGFAHRLPLVELLIMNDEVRENILKKPSTPALRKVAIEQGMHTLWLSGSLKVMQGLTPLEEIVRVVGYDNH